MKEFRTQIRDILDTQTQPENLSLADTILQRNKLQTPKPPKIKEIK